MIEKILSTPDMIGIAILIGAIIKGYQFYKEGKWKKKK